MPAGDEVPVALGEEDMELLLQLARERSNSVKSLLIERGIASRRIGSCKSSVLQAANANRVTLAVD